MIDMTFSELDDNGLRISLRGRLDPTGVDAIETRFAAATAKKNALVDLSGVTFLASTGIRMLISAAHAHKLTGHKLVLFRPQALVGEALENAGVDQFLPIESDEGAALQRLLAT